MALLAAACSDEGARTHAVTPFDSTPPGFGDALPGARDAAPDAAVRVAAPGPAGRDASAPHAAPDATAPDATAADATTPDAAVPDAAPPPDAAPEPDAARPVCGNGVVEPGEACDDHNRGDGDYCAGDCSRVTGSCGDGVLQTTELCDDGHHAGDDCARLHDGGDGACVEPGACSAGYALAGDGRCDPVMQDGVVDIFVANDCTMRVVPDHIDVPPGRTISLLYRNRSVDYPVDVWLSYGGGFLDLEPGTQWQDRFVHCANLNRPYQAFADVSTACSMFRLMINCQ
jgi:cysteine-rich repeat protein